MITHVRYHVKPIRHTLNISKRIERLAKLHNALTVYNVQNVGMPFGFGDIVALLHCVPFTYRYLLRSREARSAA